MERTNFLFCFSPLVSNHGAIHLCVSKYLCIHLTSMQHAAKINQQRIHVFHLLDHFLLDIQSLPSIQQLSCHSYLSKIQSATLVSGIVWRA